MQLRNRNLVQRFRNRSLALHRNRHSLVLSHNNHDRTGQRLHPTEQTLDQQWPTERGNVLTFLVSPKSLNLLGIVLAAALAEQAIPTTVGLFKVGLIADVIALAEEQVTSPSSFDRFIASSLRNPH